jgi:SHS2 domain-containing protein
MGYTYLDHEADIGIECTGKDRAEAFEEGALALLHLMADLDAVRPMRSIPVECRAPAADSLFVAWLNEIISLVGREEAIFSEVQVTGIREEGDDHVLTGTLRGETIDPERHHLETEVKAATYSGLALIEEPDRVTVRCVLDV